MVSEEHPEDRDERRAAQEAWPHSEAESAAETDQQELIAALYGELTAAEMTALEARLAADPALRAEWDELREAQAFLREAPGEELAPSFAFLAPPADKRRVRRAANPQGWRERLARRLRTPATGFAFAAAAMLVLIFAGLRVDRTGQGFYVGFGTPPAPAGEPTALAQAEAGSPAGGATQGGLPAGRLPGSLGDPGGVHYPLEPGAARYADAGPARFAQPDGGPGTGGDGTGYLTRAEFATYANDLIEVIEAGFHEYNARRRGETALMLRQYYDELSQQQEQNQEAFRDYVQRVWLQMLTPDGDDSLSPEWRTLEGRNGGVQGMTPVQRGSARPVRDLQ